MLEYNLMSILWSLIISLAIIGGQLIKTNGLSLLDTVIFILCIIGLVKIKFKFQKPSLIIVMAGIFILISILSLVLTPLHLNFSEYLVSFFYPLRLSSYILFVWLVNLGAFKNFNKYLDNTLIYTGLSLAIIGLLQFIFIPDLRFMSKWGWDPHYFRTVSTFLDPNFAGAFFTLTLILLTKKKAKKTTIALFVILYIALLTTFSRSSYLMFFVGGLTLSSLKKSIKFMTIVFLLFFLLFLSFQTYNKFISQPQHIDRKQSASLRLNAWQQGLILFQKYPLLGVGFNSYRYALREFRLGDEEFLSSHGASSNDSSLLFVAVTTGVIGLIFYIYFLLFIIKSAWKGNIILIPAIVGLLAHSFFTNSLFYPPILLWLLLISVVSKK